MPKSKFKKKCNGKIPVQNHCARFYLKPFIVLREMR